jgi:hypothetical protein
MTELQAFLTCSCGETVTARAKDAGGLTACSCGNSVRVPSLSELRKSAGADPFVTNPSEAIRRQHEQGINPAGDRCLLCGSSSAVFYDCKAICESSHVARIDDEVDDVQLFRMILNPFRVLLWQLLRRRVTRLEKRGHDVSVTFQLPVCDPCSAMTGKVIKVSTAKKLMRRVPLYANLLDYYPRLKITIERPA